MTGRLIGIIAPPAMEKYFQIGNYAKFFQGALPCGKNFCGLSNN